MLLARPLWVLRLVGRNRRDRWKRSWGARPGGRSTSPPRPQTSRV